MGSHHVMRFSTPRTTPLLSPELSLITTPQSSAQFVMKTESTCSSSEGAFQKSQDRMITKILNPKRQPMYAKCQAITMRLGRILRPSFATTDELTPDKPVRTLVRSSKAHQFQLNTQTPALGFVPIRELRQSARFVTPALVPSLKATAKPAPPTAASCDDASKTISSASTNDPLRATENGDYPQAAGLGMSSKENFSAITSDGWRVVQS